VDDFTLPSCTTNLDAIEQCLVECDACEANGSNLGTGQCRSGCVDCALYRRAGCFDFVDELFSGPVEQQGDVECVATNCIGGMLECGSSQACSVGFQSFLAGDVDVELTESVVASSSQEFQALLSCYVQSCGSNTE
jgi:hypothetical protein